MRLATFTQGGSTRIGVVAGDVVRIEIERIGQIENPVICEPDDTVRL